MTSLIRRLVSFFRRDRLAADLDDEMRLHVELRARKLAAQGVSDPGHAARRGFGNSTTHLEASAEFWGWPSWDRIAQDLRVAARSLRKSPSFTAVAVGTLAVGLGINTAVFSVVNAVMVRSLPYPHAGTLLSLWEESTNDNAFSSRGTPFGSAMPRRTTVSLANLPDYQKLTALAGVAGFDLTAKNLTGLGTPERLRCEFVTKDYLGVLGVKPLLGRDLTAADEPLTAPRVTLIAYQTWQNRFGGDPSVLGRSVMLDGRARQIIGVLPAGFQSLPQLNLSDRIEFWLPPEFPEDSLHNRGDHEVNAVARLRPGHTVQEARSQLDALNAALARDYPSTNSGMQARLLPLQQDLVRDVRDSLVALLGASALIVLIACVNVANLFLVRSIGRRHEVSVRFAIGANRWRVVRQFLTESALVSTFGCAAGLAAGFAVMKALVLLAPANMAMIRNVAWDWRVFAVAAAVSTLTSFVFGLAPAWQASKTRPAEALRGTSRSTAGGSQARWRSALATVEVALSLILMVGAGLLLKSFVVLSGVDLGFQPERVLALGIGLTDQRYASEGQRLRFFENLEQRVRALPGVQSVAFANRLPLRGGWSSGIEFDLAGDRSASPDFQAVSAGYFETLGIPLVRGRLLTPQDRDGAPGVAVVNQAFSRQLLNGDNPIGRRVRRGSLAPWIEIVGVVNDIRRAGKTDELRPQVYLSAAQTKLYPVALADFAVRAAGDPRALANAVQAEVWAIDKDQPVQNVRTLEEIVSASVAQRRFQTILLLVFAGVAIALALIGIYGVLSYSVTQRTSELGIRIALGAKPSSILLLVLRQAGVVVAIGIAAGLAGAWALTAYLESLLFQVKPHDWWTYAAAALTLGVVAAAAALLPARRGARIDPIVALRYE
jgi:putative ABC transport system permease protein